MARGSNAARISLDFWRKHYKNWKRQIWRANISVIFFRNALKPELCIPELMDEKRFWLNFIFRQTTLTSCRARRINRRLRNRVWDCRRWKSGFDLRRYSGLSGNSRKSDRIIARWQSPINVWRLQQQLKTQLPIQRGWTMEEFSVNEFKKVCFPT